MKRIIMFLGFVMAVIFTVIGVAREQTVESTGDVSNGLSVIAANTNMAKSSVGADKIVFSADDFEKNLNLSEVTSITVTALPNAIDGCLCIGDVLVNEGQTISGESLSLLNYRSGNSNTKEAFFMFKVNSGEYEIKCNLYFLDRENNAPTLLLEDERTFNVSTHQTVTVFGTLGAYDPDGDGVRFEIVRYAKNGVIELDGATGEYSYTPTGAYFGEDAFAYVAVDKYGNYSSAREVRMNVEKLKTEIVYSDMQNHPTLHAVLTLTEKGVMSGTAIGEKTYFMPDKSVRRLDFLVMLMHSIGVTDIPVVASTGFDDDSEIPQGMKGYVYKARSMGIITGAVDSEGNYLFCPSRDITRAEAALMVNKVLGDSVPVIKPTFSDKDDIPVWAEDAIYTLSSMGILSSINGEIAASSNITREQTAKMLYELNYYLR